MSSLDIWMREYPLVYVWIGSYGVAMLIFAIEAVMVRQKRKSTLQQVRLMRDAMGNAYGDER